MLPSCGYGGLRTGGGVQPMAARARTRPRGAQTERRPRTRKRSTGNSLQRLNTPEALGTLAAIVALVALLFVADVREGIAEGRDQGGKTTAYLRLGRAF